MLRTTENDQGAGKTDKKNYFSVRIGTVGVFFENSDEHSVTFRQESDGSHETYTLFFGFENPIDNLSQ